MTKEIADHLLPRERRITDAEAGEYVRFIRANNGNRGSINELMLLARKDTPTLVRFGSSRKPDEVTYLEVHGYAAVAFNPAAQGYQVRLTTMGRRYLTFCMTLLDGVMADSRKGRAVALPPTRPGTNHQPDPATRGRRLIDIS